MGGRGSSGGKRTGGGKNAKAIPQVINGHTYGDQVKASETLNGKINIHNTALAEKFPAYTRPYMVDADKVYGTYRVSINHPEFGTAAIFGENLSDVKWEVKQFLKDGSRY